MFSLRIFRNWFCFRACSIYLHCFFSFAPISFLDPSLPVGAEQTEEMNLKGAIDTGTLGLLDSAVVYRHIPPPAKFEDIKFARKFSLPIPVTDHKGNLGNCIKKKIVCHPILYYTHNGNDNKKNNTRNPNDNKKNKIRYSKKTCILFFSSDVGLPAGLPPHFRVSGQLSDTEIDLRALVSLVKITTTITFKCIKFLKQGGRTCQRTPDGDKYVSFLSLSSCFILLFFSYFYIFNGCV